jgi:hypothetical protein
MKGKADERGISGVLLDVEDCGSCETSIVMIGDVGSGFTSATAAIDFIPFAKTDVGRFPEREGLNVGLGGRPSGLAGRVGVLSESLISPSSLGVGSTADEGCGEGVDLIGCTGGLKGVVVDSLSP